MAAGFVDTVAGGGGLITVPALLLGGYPPLSALGTNKLQGTCGVAMASFSLIRRLGLDIAPLAWPFAAVFAGGLGGALLVRHIDPRALDLIVPVVLLGIAIYFLLTPQAGHIERRPRLGQPVFMGGVLPLIGFYDGFFGPGTGSFFTLAGIILRGWDLIRATATAKIFNFASNFAALLIFIHGGAVIWRIGAAMILGQLIGAWLGARVIVRGGARIIRPMIVSVCVLMLGRYLWQRMPLFS